MEKFKSIKIKKVGEVWLTEETLEKNFPKNCVINCDVIDMDLDPDFPILLKHKENIKYEVYSTTRQRYRNTLNKIIVKKEENMNIEKKIKCLHCNTEISGDTKCKCGKVYLHNNIIVEGVEGKDFVDVSPKLLNESA